MSPLKQLLILLFSALWVFAPTGLQAQARYDIGKADHGPGFRWLTPPDTTFVRDDLRVARSDFLLDGVAGNDLSFEITAQGRRWITLWIEAGTEDSSTVVIAINGDRRIPDWHAFNPPAEPRTDIQTIYRLFHGPAEPVGGVVRVDLIGGNDLVRLLGITVHPEPEPVDADLLARIAAAGSYGPHLDLPMIMDGEDPALTSLSSDLASRLGSNPDDAFATYWQGQLDILRSAETNIRLMGWEWATDSTGLGIFDRFHQAVMQLDGLLDRPDTESYPLFERALFQRGRLHHWLYLERGGENTRIQGERDLARLLERHPQDELLRMYNGELIPAAGICSDLDPSDSAPEWSVLQLEALCRLRTDIHWWVNERQSDTGEFGGKIGDDVELFRWWPPVVLSGDTTAFKGWKRLADGVMVTRKVHQGYSRRPIDVEHGAEFIADTAPQMVFYSDDPEYVDRLRFSAEYFTDLWTGLTPAGRRFFKSAWFSSTEVDDRPPRNRDLEMNARAVKAVRYLAWKTGEESVVGTLREWSDGWRHAAMRTDKGKPAGIIPASVRFPDEAINGDEPTWYLANMFWDYFDWDHNAGAMMLDQLLFTYTLTSDESLLEPMLVSLAEIGRLEKKTGWAEEGGEVGTRDWAFATLRDQAAFWNTVAQWRFRTGDSRYDGLLLKYGTRYTRYRLSGDESHLSDGLHVLLEGIRYNNPLRTTEVLHTDRVRTPGATHLKAMLTGSEENDSPYYAASWEGTGDGFTALVKDAASDRLDIDIFVHSRPGAPRSNETVLRVWALDPGVYELESSAQGPREIAIETRGQRLPLAVSANELTSIQLKRK